jgi:hypothetical protein
MQDNKPDEPAKPLVLTLPTQQRRVLKTIGLPIPEEVRRLLRFRPTANEKAPAGPDA